MTGTEHKLFAKNLICVCVNSHENADYQGLIYHQFSDNPIEFSGMTDFIMKTEELFDEWDFPQRGLAQRNFKKGSRGDVGYKPKKEDDRLPIEILQEKVGVRNVQNKKGTLGTFVIHVVYRQDATWQGHLIYQEKNEKKDFVSALELIKYIDSSLKD